QVDAARFRAVMETNFFGVVNVTRAALPIMRRQRSGCILQISSLGGRLASPGNSAYHAAKWAVGGFTEALAQEVAAFGVKVCALEPDGMRTNWGVRANQRVPELLPDYEPTVGAFIRAVAPLWGQENSDPAKVAALVLRLVDMDALPAHLLVGSDAVQFAAQAEATRSAEAERWRALSVSTDADATPVIADVRF
ncbi:MAG TPA: SDR family NAD(P)-dependent oxidoreductase, partial [Vicinamibacterales bacterium]